MATKFSATSSITVSSSSSNIPVSSNFKTDLKVIEIVYLHYSSVTPLS